MRPILIGPSSHIKLTDGVAIAIEPNMSFDLHGSSNFNLWYCDLISLITSTPTIDMFRAASPRIVDAMNVYNSLKSVKSLKRYYGPQSALSISDVRLANLSSKVKAVMEAGCEALGIDSSIVNFTKIHVDSIAPSDLIDTLGILSKKRMLNILNFDKSYTGSTPYKYAKISFKVDCYKLRHEPFASKSQFGNTVGQRLLNRFYQMKPPKVRVVGYDDVFHRSTMGEFSTVIVGAEPERFKCVFGSNVESLNYV